MARRLLRGYRACPMKLSSTCRLATLGLLVAYANPAAAQTASPASAGVEQPELAPPPPAVTPGNDGFVRANFTTDEGEALTVAIADEHVYVQRAVGSESVDGYRAACTMPCAVDVKGPQKIGLVRKDGDLVTVDAPLELTADATVHARIESRASMRTWGWVVWGGSLVGGLGLLGAMAATVPQGGCSGQGKPDCAPETWVLGSASLVTLIGGGLVGEAMVFTKDAGFLTVAPLVSTARTREGAPVLEGAQLVGTF
jgi:hypothetical protein